MSQIQKGQSQHKKQVTYESNTKRLKTAQKGQN